MLRCQKYELYEQLERIVLNGGRVLLFRWKIYVVIGWREVDAYFEKWMYERLMIKFQKTIQYIDDWIIEQIKMVQVSTHHWNCSKPAYEKANAFHMDFVPFNAFSTHTHTHTESGAKMELYNEIWQHTKWNCEQIAASNIRLFEN